MHFCLHSYSGKMSQVGEVAHLVVINNSHGDHRDYTDKTRTAKGRNHRYQLGKKEEMLRDQKKTK